MDGPLAYIHNSSNDDNYFDIKLNFKETERAVSSKCALKMQKRTGFEKKNSPNDDNHS